MEPVRVSIPKGAYVNEDAVENVINYVCRLGNMALIGGFGVNLTTVQDMIDQFYIVKKAYGKLDGKQIFHVVFSINKTFYFKAEYIKELAYWLGQYFGTERQVVFAVHNDTEHLHIHMAVNTVAYTNGRYQAFWEHEELKAYAKQCVARLAEKVWLGREKAKS